MDERAAGPDVPLEPAHRTSLTTAVADQLAELIIGNSFGPGAKLPPERELARRLQVSRIVVREALRTLAERGLVQVRPGVGTFVVAMPQSAVTGPLALFIRRNGVGVHHLFELRSALEPAIAAGAARAAQGADLAALEENLRRTEEIISRVEHDVAAIEQFAWADLEFHQLLARASSNPLYQIVLEPLIDSQLEVRREGARLPGAARRAFEGHEAVYAALLALNAEAAAREMHRHLETVASLFAAGSDRRETRRERTHGPGEEEER